MHDLSSFSCYKSQQVIWKSHRRHRGHGGCCNNSSRSPACSSGEAEQVYVWDRAEEAPKHPASQDSHDWRQVKILKFKKPCPLSTVSTRANTDILLGKNCGLQTLLVGSGVHRFNYVCFVACSFVWCLVCLFVILFVCLLFCLSVCYFVCLFGLRCHFSFLSAALKKRVHGKQVKKKKRESLLRTSTWTSLETCWTESRTSKFMHFIAVVNTS